MNTVSKTKTLYGYEDGDTITPRMGVQIAVGHGLQQFYNAETHQVTNTNFNPQTGGFPPTIFPQPYSSKGGAVVVPDAGGQWFFNNPENPEAAILDANGNVKTAFADRFAETSVTNGGKVFPAISIIDNLVNNVNKISTDIYIYYKGTYRGKSFTCSQCIPVQSVVGEAYQLLVSCSGENGSGDEIINSENETLTYTAYLQGMGSGININGAVITFEHFGSNGWEPVTNNTGITEITSVSGGKSLKLYEAAVDGVEMFRAKAVYAGQIYYKVFEPSDEHDPYYIVDGCSIAGDTVKENDIVNFSPKVYKRVYDGEDEDVTTSEGWTFQYTLIAQNTGDTITAFNQTGITYARLMDNGGIAIRIVANRT